MSAPPTFRRWYFGVKQSEILELGVGWQTFRAAVEEPFCSFRFQIFSPFTKILRSHKNVLHGVQSEELFAPWLIAAVDDLECSSGTHGERILKLGCDIRGRHSRAFGALVDDTHAQSLFGIELDRYTVSGFQRIRWYFAHMSFRGLVIQFGRYGRGRMSAFPDEFCYTNLCGEGRRRSNICMFIWSCNWSLRAAFRCLSFTGDNQLITFKIVRYLFIRL